MVDTNFLLSVCNFIPNTISELTDYIKNLEFFDVCFYCNIMKIPFHRLFGPVLKVYGSQCSYLCRPDLFGGQFYVQYFSLFGIALNLLDLLNLRKGGFIKSFWSLPATKEYKDYQRDWKLCGTALSLEHNIMLALASLIGHPVLFMPYLIAHGITLCLDVLVMLLYAILRKEMITFHDFFIIGFALHNWTQVFCAFRNRLNKCDI